MAKREKQQDFGAAIAAAYSFEGPALDWVAAFTTGPSYRRPSCGCRCPWSTDMA